MTTTGRARTDLATRSNGTEPNGTTPNGTGLSAAERERLEVAGRTAKWLAEVPVEGSLGVTVGEITPYSLVMSAPVPWSDGRPDPHAMAVLTCVLTDSAAGLVAALGRPRGQGGATIELRLDYGPLPGPEVRRLSAKGVELHSVGGAELSSAVLTDDRGQVLARATGHFAAVPAGTGGLPAPPPPGDSDALLQALRLGPAENPADRRIELPGVLANPRGVIHGGALLALVQEAQRAVMSDDAAGEPRLMSTQTEFLRPLACGAGSGARVVTRFGRRGRRFSTLHSEVALPDGRPAVTMSGLWASG